MTDEAAAHRLLHRLVRGSGRATVAERFGVSVSTVDAWLTAPSRLSRRRVLELQGLAPKGGVRFIDLFAGIGGIRKGFEDAGARCVLTCEWNAFARKTYEANFPSAPDHIVAGDINELDASAVPDHDILLGGFPCQPFSVAGVSKKNALGRPHGFKDPTQGTLFFQIKRILEAKRPPAFLLENVKNLKSHDSGRTFRIVLEKLEELGYEIHHRVVDGRHWTPQHRERILIAGFHGDSGPRTDFWDLLELPPPDRTMGDYVLHGHHPREAENPDGNRYYDRHSGKVHDRYTLSPGLWAYLQAYAAKHRAAGNGFGYGLVGPSTGSRTLSARYYKDGSEILVSQGEGRIPRRLTPRECARLMGFPEDFIIPVSDTQAYRQFGNSVVVPLMKAVADILVEQVSLARGLREPGGQLSIPSVRGD